MQTHETYIQRVADLAIDRLSRFGPPTREIAEFRDKARRCKLVYGAGDTRTRGVTYFSRWANGHGPENPDPFVEVCAFGEHSVVQLAGTTIHEIGHVTAGHKAGHGKAWKAACHQLGLRRIKAAGTNYAPAMFAPDLREQLWNLEPPTDGNPAGNGQAGGIDLMAFLATLLGPGQTVGGCTAGHGARGGRSRGKGSGSRLLKVECGACGCNVRMTRKWIETAGTPTCGCGNPMNEPAEAEK